MGGFSQAVLRVYRNGVQLGTDQLQTLSYTGGTAPFSFTTTIAAELAEYDVELLLRNGAGQEFSVRRTTNIVAGDVFIIQGQSNATTIPVSGNADAYISPFVRTFDLGTADTDGMLTYQSWYVANGGGSSGMGSLDAVGGVGQWGMVMGNLLMTANNVPVAILNGGNGGQPISFFQRNDSNPSDILTNYGRLLYRLQKGGLDGAVRAILYYQGESDMGQATQYQAAFTALRSDWLQDYPSLEKLYVFQVRETNPLGVCGDVARFDVDLRNRQRLFADQFANLSVMSMNGLDGYDGCHYAFTNGYENIGFNIARMLQRDLYGGPSLPNTNPPNPAYAVLTGASHNLIRIPLRNRTDAVTFASGAIADFAVVGSGVSIVSGTITNGVIQLTLSGNATGATSVVYTGHAGPASGNWVANANGIGLLSFIEPVLTDSTLPVITLLGANPVIVTLGQSYVDPGAAASDNLDGDLTNYIVINASAVNTAVPGDYPVTYNVSDVAGNAATQVTRTVHVNSTPSAPSTTGDNRCGSGTVNLGASGSGGTLKWYSDMALTMQVATGTSYMPSLSSTTTFYVTETSGVGGVSSPSAVTGTINTLPTIMPGANPAVPRGTASANLTYSATTGVPDKYSIDFDAAAEAQGFADVTLASLPASPIVITVPGAATPGTYNGTLTVTNSTTGCTQTSGSAITVTVTGPVPVNDNVARPGGSTFIRIPTSALLGNDSRVDANGNTIGSGSGLSISAVHDAGDSNFTVTLAEPFIIYTPANRSETTTRTFTYDMSDGTASNTASVTVTTVDATFSLQIMSRTTPVYGGGQTSATFTFLTIPNQMLAMQYMTNTIPWTSTGALRSTPARQDGSR